MYNSEPYQRAPDDAIQIAVDLLNSRWSICRASLVELHEISDWGHYALEQLRSLSNPYYDSLTHELELRMKRVDRVLDEKLSGEQYGQGTDVKY